MLDRALGTGHPVAVGVVKTVHSIAFVGELAAILWLVASGATGRRDRTVALAGIAVAAEASVFVVNGGVCPMTPLAERLGAGQGSVSDIWLPSPIARTIPIWSTSLIVLAVALHARRLVGRSGGVSCRT